MQGWQHSSLSKKQLAKHQELNQLDNVQGQLNNQPRGMLTINNMPHRWWQRLQVVPKMSYVQKKKSISSGIYV